MFKKSILSSIAILLILVFSGCHHKSDDVTDPITTYTNADLSSMWFLYINQGSQNEQASYIVFNGGGVISDLSGFGLSDPRGFYTVQSTGDFSFTFRTIHDGDLGPFTGMINADKVTATVGTTGDCMKKITSFSSVTGTWVGTLAETQGPTYNIIITVDGNGSITALTGFSNFQEGRIGVDPDNRVVAFWRANTGDAYNQIRIDGALNGTHITGTYGIDSTDNPGGTVSLTKQ